jgi:hypothetical protein
VASSHAEHDWSERVPRHITGVTTYAILGEIQDGVSVALRDLRDEDEQVVAAAADSDG